MIWHEKQAQRWGCIYHALYSVTGHRSLLDHVNDVSEARARIRLHHLGYTLMPLLIKDWSRIMSVIPPDQSQLCVLTIRQSDETTHAVGAEIHHDRVIISDSAHLDVQEMSLQDLERSDYRDPLLIELLIPLRLDDFEPEDASEALRRIEHDRQRSIEAMYSM